MFRAVFRAHALIHDAHKRFLARHALSVTEFDMIAALGNTNGMRMKDLAAGMITTPSNVTRVCQNLVKRGLVERHRSDASDREVVARLTPEGERAFEAYFPEAVSFTTGLIDKLVSPEDQRQVGDILDRFHQQHEALARKR